MIAYKLPHSSNSQGQGLYGQSWHPFSVQKYVAYVPILLMLAYTIFCGFVKDLLGV